MGDPVPNLDGAVFQTDQATSALEKYAAVTNLTVRLYGRDAGMIGTPIGSNRLFELFSKGREPTIVGECVKGCLAQAGTPAVIEDGHGLAVVGTPFTSAGETRELNPDLSSSEPPVFRW
jgi:hypothetical protein